MNPMTIYKLFLVLIFAALLPVWILMFLMTWIVAPLEGGPKAWLTMPGRYWKGYALIFTIIWTLDINLEN